MDEQRFLPEGWDFTESEPDEALAKRLEDKRLADTAAVLKKNAEIEAEFNK